MKNFQLIFYMYISIFFSINIRPVSRTIENKGTFFIPYFLKSAINFDNLKNSARHTIN